MGDYKPLLLVLLCFFVIAGFLNLVISPFIAVSSPDADSILYGFSNFIQNGWDITFNLVFWEIDTNISPVTWLWFGIDGITDFMVTQVNILTYLPDFVSLPLLIIFISSLAYVILAWVRGN